MDPEEHFLEVATKAHKGARSAEMKTKASSNCCTGFWGRQQKLGRGLSGSSKRMQFVSASGWIWAYDVRS